MISEWIDIFRNHPFWISYGVWVAVSLTLLLIVLVVFRRKYQLSDALRKLEEIQQELSIHKDQAKSDAQTISDQRVELAGWEAIEPQHRKNQKDLELLRQELDQAKTANTRLETELVSQKSKNEENIVLLNKTGETLKGEFQTLAAEVMRTHGEDFEKQNAQRMHNVLQPLKEHIHKFETELRNVHHAAGKDREALKAEILNLTKQSMQVSKEAENLTRALKADTQKQGAWGEMVLASILDRSGLREGEEYITQAHHRDEQGRSLRPDVVVNLPQGRRLVIDSKVSLVAYERAVNAENDSAKNTAMKAHVASVKSHIDTLASKQYHQLDDNSVEYVIMFMPIESAFSEAVRHNPDIALYATEKNIVIASPMNLMVALKTVENLWSVEKRNKNALEIAKRAGALYDKFHGFIDDLDKVGTQLERARSSHESAVKKLQSGRGNLVSQVETLKVLGAKTEKQLNLESIDENNSEDTID